MQEFHLDHNLSARNQTLFLSEKAWSVTRVSFEDSVRNSSFQRIDHDPFIILLTVICANSQFIYSCVKHTKFRRQNFDVSDGIGNVSNGNKAREDSTRHLGGASWLACAFRYCRFYCVFFRIAPISNMEFQVKVDYVKGKRKIFMVSSRLVSAAEYRFKDLVEDITSSCTKLNYLNETTIRLRYLDYDVAIGRQNFVSRLAWCSVQLGSPGVGRVGCSLSSVSY